ncbi:curamycin polyketide synthase [Streptomyces cinnamoneus]|uniref:Curamycin polyketide synthase n=1 Tax=Streptomyces cinnamoneus TaxID=53446 RepID=A0A2G1XAP3_STRCJ|nr:acyl carrier protein [Streptomyces cinnamoneus]PHQ48290.1 curamycin polyketide synthase [Streptomyces cinnamoneus]PPT15921.1 acyl carrier protein [Streptomyces cinnamoneus]
MTIKELTFGELAALMKQSAGVTGDPARLEQAPDTPFASLGVDSLGLLGIVGELENRYAVSLPTDAERCKTPAEFIGVVNDALKTGV